MSIFQKIRRHDSAIMYRRYAEIILTDESSHNEIPIEGMFRLMEMYKYDAYFDGTYDNWHIPIVKALDMARIKVFGTTQKLDCVLAIETALQKLARKVLQDSEKEQLHAFLNAFKAVLSAAPDTE